MRGNGAFQSQMAILLGADLNSTDIDFIRNRLFQSQMAILLGADPADTADGCCVPQIVSIADGDSVGG